MFNKFKVTKVPVSHSKPAGITTNSEEFSFVSVDPNKKKVTFLKFFT